MPPPPCVLLLGGPSAGAALPEVAGPLLGAGATVLAALMQSPEGHLPAEQIRTWSLVDAAQEHGPAFRRAVRGADPAERIWLHVRDDHRIAEQLPTIDLVAPLDEQSAPAAARLVEAHPHLILAETMEAAAAETTQGLPARRPGPPSGEASRPVAARVREMLPGLSREKREAQRASEGSSQALDLLQRGREVEAERVVAEALTKVDSLRLRADLLGDVVSWQLAHGQPAAMARDAYAAELAVADQHHAAGEYDDAAAAFVEAMRTAFHPVLHFDGPSSPLADDPAGFVAPLRTSSVARALRDPATSRTKGASPSADRSADGRTRLFIATQHNADFLSEIREHLTGHPDFETGFELFQDTPAVKRFGKQPLAFAAQVLAQRPGLPKALENTFRTHLEQNDVVFVEWATALTALISRIDHPGTRVVVRLHSYEVFTQWPHITAWSNIDDLVFVSDHLRDFAVKAIPGLAEPEAPRLHVIPNAMELQRFVRPKSEDARFTLGVVGASKLVKDPRWAIDVLRHLRKQDERYRLLLIRSKFQDTSAATHEYAQALAGDIAELEPTGAVVPMKHTDDVPAALEDVGVVVSSSLRESFHMGLVEGVASGALPVVRDWPFFRGAARQLFPDAWVVDSPEAAAQRIFALTQDVDTWRAETADASEYALETWDWTVVRGRFEELLRRR